MRSATILDGVTPHVGQMIDVWRARDGDIEDLTLDAFEALRLRTDLSVVAVPEFVPAGAQLDCSVAGGYREDPPTLIVTESASWRRQHFTLLHELGHHLQRTDIELGEAVLAHRDPELFEEAACDAFAARILLPDEMIAVAVAADGPTAQSAAELFAMSNASRAAICVRLAGMLKSSAVVAVIDATGHVSFAAARGGMYPPARESDQSDNPLIRAMLAGRGERDYVVRNDAHIRYSHGGTSIQLYGQAAWVGDRMIAIMVEDAAPWLSFSPPRVGTAQYSDNQRFESCDRCGETLTRFICPRCRTPRCPRGHCECTDAATRTCTECYLEKHASQFEPGAAVCKECAA